MNRYRSYKLSGVEWIGKIPKHWEVKRLRSVSNYITQKGTPTMNDIKISPENVESFTGKCFNYYSDYTNDGVKFKKGDILFNKLRVYLTKVLYTSYGGYSMGEMIVVRPKSIEGEYLFHLMKSHGFIDWCNSFNLGVKLPRVSPDIILNSEIPVPSKNEQQKIVKFIKVKTDLIQKNIQLKEQKIELLEEQKISIINQSVLKGINKNVKLRDSGVEWIGKIPFNWNVKLIKYVFKPIRVKSETGEEDLLSVLIRKGVVKRKDFLDQDSDHITRSESLIGYLKCSKGNLVNNIMKMGYYCLGISDYDGIVSPAYSVFEIIDKRNCTKYWEYLLKTELYVGEYRKRSKGIQDSRMRLYDDYFLSIHSIVPPFDEQKKIVESIELQTIEIDKLILLEQNKIDLLKDYRQSLISEVVTGKIDVSRIK